VKLIELYLAAVGLSFFLSFDEMIQVSGGCFPHRHATPLGASQGGRRHSPNVSTILLRFFYDFSTIIPRAHFPAFLR
jgi:hypothetical protein